MKRDGQGQRCMERDRDLVFVVSIHRPFDLIAGINNIVIIIINIKGGGGILDRAQKQLIVFLASAPLV